MDGAKVSVCNIEIMMLLGDLWRKYFFWKSSENLQNIYVM